MNDAVDNSGASETISVTMIYHPATGPKSNVYVNDEEGYVYIDQDAMDSPVRTIAYYELIVEGHEPIRLTPDQAVLVNW